MTPKGPHAPGDRFEPQPGLVLRPHLDGLLRVRLTQTGYGPLQRFKATPAVSRVAVPGCLGRGTRSEKPRSRNQRQPVWGTTSMPQQSLTNRTNLRAVHNPPAGDVTE